MFREEFVKRNIKQWHLHERRMPSAQNPIDVLLAWCKSLNDETLQRLSSLK
jgi:hypothetical protein